MDLQIRSHVAVWGPHHPAILHLGEVLHPLGRRPYEAAHRRGVLGGQAVAGPVSHSKGQGEDVDLSVWGAR